MLKRFAPILIMAFFTGLLFRIADQSGVAMFRMFGTQGIVVIGLMGANLLRSIQREDGVRRLEEQLQELTGELAVSYVGRIGSLPFWIVDTPKGKLLLGTSDVPQSMRQARAIRRFNRHVQQMWDTALKQGGLKGKDGFEAALVLLRRRAENQKVELENNRQVTLVNPEGLTGFVKSHAA